MRRANPLRLRPRRRRALPVEQQQHESDAGADDGDDGWRRFRRMNAGAALSVVWNAIGSGSADLAGDPLRNSSTPSSARPPRARVRELPSASCASRTVHRRTSCTWWRAIAPTVRSSFHHVHAGVSHGTACSVSSNSRVDVGTRHPARGARTDRSAPPGTRDRARRHAPSWPRTAGLDRGARSTRSATNRGTTAPGRRATRARSSRPPPHSPFR